MKRLPDFLVIGAQKCGTTALVKNLSMHPDVFVPYWNWYGEQRPEFHFFNLHFDNGVEWYKSIFDSEAKAVGEKSPEYLAELACHERMAQVVPDARLIVILRDPIERAYSAFNFARSLHPDNCKWFGDDDCVIDAPIAEAFDQLIATKLETHNCFRFGRYADQLNHLAQFFDTSQVFITTMEQLKARPDWVMPQVFQFIGVNPNHKIDWVGNDYKSTPYREPMSDWARQTLREYYRESTAELSAMVST